MSKKSKYQTGVTSIVCLASGKSYSTVSNLINDKRTDLHSSKTVEAIQKTAEFVNEELNNLVPKATEFHNKIVSE